MMMIDVGARAGRWTDGTRRALARGTQKKQTAEELQAQLRQRAEAQARLVAAQQAAAASAAVAGKRDEGGHAIAKGELQQMLKELAPDLEFDEDVQEVLLEMTDDFVDTVLEHASMLAKHRGSEQVEVKDVLLHLDRQWDMHIPGYSGEEVKKFPQKRLETHAKRMAAVRRTVAAANAAQLEAKKQAKLAAERAAKKGGDAEDA